MTMKQKCAPSCLVTPLPTTRHIFTSESAEHFTTGHTYTVIKSGLHWHKEYGFGVWLTNDEYLFNPQRDEDLGVFLSVRDFHTHFFQH